MVLLSQSYILGVYMRLFMIFTVVLGVFLVSCTDSESQLDPTPTLPEIDSVVISQGRGSDTVNVIVVKQNSGGSTRSSINDRGAEDHVSLVTFSSTSFTSGEVAVIIYGKSLSPLDPPSVLKRCSFTPSRTSITETVTGTIGSIGIVSASGTTCTMTGQVILKP